jgi:hypothetical protein
MKALSTETESGYENKARRIANDLGLRMTAEQVGTECPKWGQKNGRCEHIHGLHYKVTLRRRGRSLSFDFWNSQHDAQKGKEPGYYDILSCVSADASMPTDPDEIAEEFGPMPPSQAIAAATFSARLMAFFSGEELRQLSEIS